LPPGAEEKVFDKFFRGSSVAPDGRRGVGLGLAICKAIVESHRGTITVSNLPRTGARFVVRLPSTETPPAIEVEPAAASAGA
jgi:two-component system sensor histidine kinase KdpD